MKSIVRFIHISDTHFGPSEDFELLGVRTYQHSRKVVEAINKLPLEPDFVIHTGDIIHNGNFSAEENSKAYQLGSELLNQIRFPLYLIPGNQDVINAPDIIKLFKMENFELLLPHTLKLCYRFTRGELTFLALDGRENPELAIHQGQISLDQLEILQQEINRSSQLVVFIHFVPFIFDCPWAEREMTMLNAENFHQILVANQNKICGVFHGHLHLNTQTYVDGILYSGVGSSCVQLDYWPDLKEFAVNLNYPLAFNLVTISGNKTLIKQYSI